MVVGAYTSQLALQPPRQAMSAVGWLAPAIISYSFEGEENNYPLADKQANPPTLFSVHPVCSWGWRWRRVVEPIKS